jgi:hypothetical protein
METWQRRSIECSPRVAYSERMDPTAMNSSQGRDALEAWLARSRAQLSDTNPVHIHVDELCPQIRAHRRRWLPNIVRLYADAILLLGESVDQIQPILVIPLKELNKMTCNVPPFTRIESLLASEPPSIYLCRREAAKHVRLIEVYRRYLAGFRPVRQQIEGVFFFYEVARVERSRRQGWEFTRTILGEHYPSELRRAWESSSE